MLIFNHESNSSIMYLNLAENYTVREMKDWAFFDLPSSNSKVLKVLVPGEHIMHPLAVQNGRKCVFPRVNISVDASFGCKALWVVSVKF